MTTGYFRGQKHKEKADKKQAARTAEGHMLYQQEQQRLNNKEYQAQQLINQIDMKEGEVYMNNTTNNTNKAVPFFIADQQSAPTIGSMFSANAAAGIKQSLSDIEEAAYRAQMRTLEMMQQMMYQTALQAIADYETAKGRGTDRAMQDMMNSIMNQTAPVQPESTEPVEYDLDSTTSLDDILAKTRKQMVIKRKKEEKQLVAEITVPVPSVEEELKAELALPEKKQRYAKARVMKCGLCGEEGHNKRTCNYEDIQAELAAELKL